MTAELEIAERVVELVRRLAGPDAQAEAYVERLDLWLTRFANSVIHQNVADETTSVRLRVHLDGRTATGSTTLLDVDGLRGLVERTLAAARVCPVDPTWPGLTPPTAPTGAGSWDDATAGASPEERADRVRAFVAAAGGLEAAGYCRTANRRAAFANTAGHSLTGRSTEAAMDGVVRTTSGSGVRADGVARGASGRLADLAGDVLGARAAAKARAGADPVELPPGRYEVVLESGAVGDVLINLAMFGFNGKAYVQRRSFVEPGVAQFDPSITLVDDVSGTPALPFDADGTPRGRFPLVEAGVTRAVPHDRRTAAEAGVASTGHAVSGHWRYGPVPLSLRLEPAGTPVGGSAVTEVPGPAADSETAALLAGVERGLLVTDFWYTRVLDPRSLVMTGLTRNGVWLVERGEIVSAVRDLRFTQCYPAALGPGAVLGLGGASATRPDNWEAAWWSAPALRLAGWNFTGGASG